MTIAQIVGIVGSLILVLGAAWPDIRVPHPAQSFKNQLFTVGNACMFAYSYLNFLDGGEIFFIFLQVLIAVSTVLMLLNTSDRVDAPILALFGGFLAVWSLSLFQGYSTLLFVIGLVIVGIGFALKMATVRRYVALGVGSAIIAYFSYLVADWIFVWLNVFFALFSLYHARKLSKN